jgi:hypothetical protein
VVSNHHGEVREYYKIMPTEEHGLWMARNGNGIDLLAISDDFIDDDRINSSVRNYLDCMDQYISTYNALINKDDIDYQCIEKLDNVMRKQIAKDLDLRLLSSWRDV